VADNITRIEDETSSAHSSESRSSGLSEAEKERQARESRFQALRRQTRRYNIFNRCWFSREDDVGTKVMADEPLGDLTKAEQILMD